MIKKVVFIALITLILIPVGVMAAGFQGGYQWGGGSSGTGSGQTVLLTEEEQNWMVFMREEEKLARDTYLYLYAKWKMPIFSNIASAEQRHTDAIKTLLDRYGISDPAAGNGPGKFSNPSLQVLYNNLIAKGSISKVEALNVGVIIEVVDINDLDEAITTARHNDIKTVYGNLRQASYNHLDAFESQLAKY